MKSWVIEAEPRHGTFLCRALEFPRPHSTSTKEHTTKLPVEPKRSRQRTMAARNGSPGKWAPGKSSPRKREKMQIMKTANGSIPSAVQLQALWPLESTEMIPQRASAVPHVKLWQVCGMRAGSFLVSW